MAESGKAWRKIVDSENESKLPWNHNYTMTVSISRADQSETINPARDSSYSEDEWNALTKDEQEKWLSWELDEFMSNCVESRWTL
jgi:hypothetical protein